MSDQIDPSSPIVVAPPRRGRRRMVAAAAAGTLFALAATSAAVATAGADTATGLRTALVTEAPVAETMALTGAVQPTAQAAVAFPAAGTVAEVFVTAGQEISVGHVLATLDPGPLEDAVDVARADLAQADLALEQALAGEPVTAGSSGGSGGGSTSGGGAAGGGASGASMPQAVSYSSTVAEMVVGPIAAGRATAGSSVSDGTSIDAARQNVVVAARAADDALAVAEASLALATDVCAGSGAVQAATGSIDGTDSTADTDSTDDTGLACQAALAQVLADQQAAAAALDALETAANELDRVIQASLDSSEAPPGSDSDGSDDALTGADAEVVAVSPDSAGPGAGSASGDGASSPDPSASGAPSTDAGATATEVSAERLVAYQAAADAAAARLVVARQALAQTTIVSPIAGTVVSSTLAVGDEVTAASSTANVLVAGDGGYEVAATVTVDEMTRIAVGQSARVAVDGQSEPLSGEVVGVGLVSASGDSGRTFPVSIGLESDVDLRAGTLADVEVTLASTAAAVAVPASAIDLSGTRATVELVEADGTTRSVPVTLGAIGGPYVEVSGVEVGAEVVIADLAEPLPDSASEGSADSSGPGGGAGFPGGTGGPGSGAGFPGGAAQMPR